VHETAADADLVLLLCLQYNVTVSGVDKGGSITKGSNMLQFVTPSLPAFRLTKVRATSPNKGLGVAEPGALGNFQKVCFFVACCGDSVHVQVCVHCW
jgi:hypothetical protein